MNNLKITTKLQILLLLPVLGLLFLSSIVTYERYTSFQRYDKLNQIVSLSTKITSLVHEVQKERGMTAGFIGSKGVKFKDKLPTQRELTNKRKKEFEIKLMNIDLSWYGDEFNTLIKDALNRLSNIEEKRTQISSLSIGGKEAIGYFTNMNASFLEIVRNTSSFSPNNDMTQQLTSYTNFLLAKERAGVERAVGAVTFAADKFLSGMKLKFNRLISEQNAYIYSFEKLTNKETFEFYKKTLQGKAVEEVIRMRNIALNAKDENGFGVDSYYWFQTITEKINLLKKIDDHLANGLIKKADEIAKESEIEMIFYIVLCFIVLIASLILGQIITKNIIEGIRALSKGIDDFFKFLNKESENVKLLAEDRKDAIGTVSYTHLTLPTKRIV